MLILTRREVKFIEINMNLNNIAIQLLYVLCFWIYKFSVFAKDTNISKKKVDNENYKIILDSLDREIEKLIISRNNICLLIINYKKSSNNLESDHEIKDTENQIQLINSRLSEIYVQKDYIVKKRLCQK